VTWADRTRALQYGGWLAAVSGAILLAFSARITQWATSHGAAGSRPILWLWWSMSLAGLLVIGRFVRRKPGVIKAAAAWMLFMLSVRPSMTGDPHLLDNLRVSATAGRLSSAQLLLAQCITLLALALIVYGAVRLRRLHSTWRSLQRLTARALRVPAPLYVSVLAPVLVATTVFLSWYCYRFLPSIPDTVEQYMHAKVMARGQWYGRAPVLAWEGYFPSHLHIEPDGKWYSRYQPLHIFLISLGHRLSAPWLVNPMLAGLTLVAAYALARRVYDEATARVAGCLVVCSPLILFMSSEYMSHVTAQLTAVVFVLCYAEMVEATIAGHARRAYLFAVGTGLAISGVFLSRPLVAVGIALPVILHGSAMLVRAPRRHLVPSIVAVTAVLPGLIGQLYYNRLLTGDALLPPYLQRHQQVFGEHEGIAMVLSKTLMEWNQMNVMLFDWLAPNALLALVAVCGMSRRYAGLVLGSVLSLTLVNMLNPFSSFTWGPRYVYELAIFLIVLTAAGIVRLPRLLSRVWPAVSDVRVLQGVSILVVVGLFASGWPFLVTADLARYARNYQHNNHGFYTSMLRQSTKPALIFVERAHYQHVAMINPADEREPVVFAVDQGRDRNCRLIHYMPTRQAYVERRSRIEPAESCAAPPPVRAGLAPDSGGTPRRASVGPSRSARPELEGWRPGRFAAEIRPGRDEGPRRA